MEFEIQAGAKIDIMTPAEMRRELAAWMAEVRRGVKFRRAGAQGQASGGTFRIDASLHTGDVGPAAGFLWSVTSIAVQGGAYDLTADTFAAYVGEPSGSTVVATGISRRIGFSIGELVLNGPDSLTITGLATGTDGTDVSATLLVAEIPDHLAWQLLG